MNFNPNEHMMQLKSGFGDKATSSDYLAVKWRMVWFREAFPQGVIKTEVVIIDLDREIEKDVWEKGAKVKKVKRGFALFKATVTDSKGGEATAHGSESCIDFDDYIEKAETKAVGRALAMLGYGTQFTGDELDEKNRLADAPVDRPERNNEASGQSATNTSPTSASTNKTLPTKLMVTSQQLANLRTGHEILGKKVPDNLGQLSSAAAEKLLSDLRIEYDDMKKQSKPA